MTTASTRSAVKLRVQPDVLAVIVLTALWLFFFWRLVTPIQADQASLKEGDFSGQFAAFAAYQYSRFSTGQIPLWNPYNNGGLPFLADTQAAVFYPPRLLSLAIAYVTGGFQYATLQGEMMAHVLAYSLMMYLLVRRLTRSQSGTYYAGLAAGIVGAYGGFMTGYAPLQLAILEAATWLPLALLGIHEATRTDRTTLRRGWMLFAGFGLGLSWMAGHPQSSWFMTWLLIAFLAYRVYQNRWHWTTVVEAAVLLGITSFGLAAVQLIPGIEYLLMTTRSGFGFDAKSNGFPLHDIFQFFVPSVVSVFSPLYIGICALALAAAGVALRAKGALFWAASAVLALLWSFGANGVLYPLLYNLLPGAYFFRGQERAALLVANAGAILVGLGVAALQTLGPEAHSRDRIRRGLWLGALVVSGTTLLIFVSWVGNREAYGPFVSAFTLSAVAALAAAVIIPHMGTSRVFAVLILCAIIVELFTANMDTPAVYDPVPAGQQIRTAPTPLLAAALEDDSLFRVDGFRGLGDNYGSLYGLADIHGISPLWLNRAYSIIEGDIPDARVWEVFAVKYVYTDWNELSVPSTVLAVGTDRYGEIRLHALQDPRPFAVVAPRFEVVSDAEALRRLADPAFAPRTTVLLSAAPELTTEPGAGEVTSAVMVTPEDYRFTVTADAPAVLSVSLLDYPGWRAAVDGQPTPILRAYGALSALVVPAGTSEVTFTFAPGTFYAGAAISLVTWCTLGVLAAAHLINRQRKL